MRFFFAFFFRLGLAVCSLGLFACGESGFDGGLLGKEAAVLFPADLPPSLRQRLPQRIPIRRGALIPLLYEDEWGRMVGGVLPWDLTEIPGRKKASNRGVGVRLSQEGGWLAKQMLICGTDDNMNFNYGWAKRQLQEKRSSLPCGSLFFLDESRFRRDWVAGRVNSFSFRRREVIPWQREAFLEELQRTYPETAGVQDWEFTDWQASGYLFDGLTDEIPVGVWSFVSPSTRLSLKIQADAKQEPPVSLYVGRFRVLSGNQVH